MQYISKSQINISILHISKFKLQLTKTSIYRILETLSLGMVELWIGLTVSSSWRHLLTPTFTASFERLHQMVSDFTYLFFLLKTLLLNFYKFKLIIRTLFLFSDLLQKTLTLKPEDQLALYYALQDSLKQRGILM